MRRALITTAVLVCIISQVIAQDATRAIRVTYVAGENVYIAAGRKQGIFAGDTLTVVTESGDSARIYVLSSMSDRSVLQYLDVGFGLDVGSILRLYPNHADSLNELPEHGPAMARAAVEDPLLEENLEPDERDFINQSKGISVSGHLNVGVNSLQSRTESVFVPSAHTTRTYLTPNSMLLLDADGLPHDLELRVRMRSEYRYASGGRSPNPTVSLRAYELHLARQFDAMSIQVGRFSTPHAPTSGYWDGIQLLRSGSEVEYGASFGFLPVRSNEQISFDMPKAALFGQFARKTETMSTRLEAVYLEVHPTNDLMTRRALGLTHRLNWSALSSHSRLEVDRDPESGAWVVTRLSGRVSASIVNSLEAHGRYDVGRPYSMYRAFDVISYRRDRMTVGLGYRASFMFLSTDLVWNYAYDVDDTRKLDGRSVTGSASLNRLMDPKPEPNATSTIFMSVVASRRWACEIRCWVR